MTKMQSHLHAKSHPHAAEVLPSIADQSPQEIIDQLVKVGEEWANGRPQDNDVTFVVLKVKEVLLN